MPDRKLAELKGFLDQLPPQEAAALARKLELQRALGQETPPAAGILASLRRQLRVAQPARTPTLYRLLAAGFEEFLVDHPGATRMPGLIPRASMEPWWQALRHWAPRELKAQEAELASYLAANDWSTIERFASAAQQAARGWTEAALAAPADIAPADPGLRADFAEIAHLLAIADPLRQAIEVASTVAARLGQTQGRRILEFSDETIAEAKRQYLRFAEAHGSDARYVALGIMNRLERPWQILRLGRALAWNPEDAAGPHQEFALIGQRLMHDLALLAAEIDALMPSTEKSAATDFPPMQQALTRFIEGTEQLLGPMGFRRESAWGERILAIADGVGRALSVERLAGVAECALAVLPQERDSGTPDLRIVLSGETIEQAMRAARFLMLLRQRGGRLGLAASAETTIERLGAALAGRSDRLYELLAQDHGNRAAIAQLNAAIRIAGILFEDGRADQMARRLRGLQRNGTTG